MAKLATMPPLAVSQTELAKFGTTWTANGGSLSRTPPHSSGDLGKLFDTGVGTALAVMLGSVPIEVPTATSLTPTQPDCVEVGPVRIIGGVKPQNFDVGYRPDGVRLCEWKSFRFKWKRFMSAATKGCRLTQLEAAPFTAKS